MALVLAASIEISKHAINTFFADLTLHQVETVAHCAQLLRMGIANRVTSDTTMNEHSFRSHAIFSIWVKVVSLVSAGGGEMVGRRAKLNLVDLAGSQRHGKAGKCR